MFDTVTPRPAGSIGSIGASRLARVGSESLYLLIGFPLAIAAFVVTVTGLSLGVGLAITLVGLPVLVLALFVSGGFASIERLLLTTLVGVAPAPVRYRRTAAGATPLRRLLDPLGDLQRWFDVAHALVVFPLAIAGFVVTVAWWSVALAGSTYALWGWLIPRGDGNRDLAELVGLGDSYLVRAGFNTVIGLVALVTLPLVITIAARARSAVGEVFLLSLARGQGELETVVAGRDATRAADQATRQQLERDIHDGPQQRLVRLAMDLGRAEVKAEKAAPDLRDALSDARRQVGETLDELRALSRGIAPPVLVDRGLAAAIDELAVRSPVPTTCDLRLGDRRFESHVESAAYFAVAEAMTNALKHSEASRITIQAELDGETLRVTTHDDGVGGADPAKGYGLAGLRQRLRGVDGTLAVISPADGPTTVVAEVPCGPTGETR